MSVPAILVIVSFGILIMLWTYLAIKEVVDAGKELKKIKNERKE